jgi:diamine N-acetyltransferase
MATDLPIEVVTFTRYAPGIRAYTAAGFKPAGRLRQSGYWLGQPCDELIMDALPEDYPGPSHFSG